MNLYKFDRDGVIETIFANDRDELADVLGDICGTIVEVANDCDLTLAEYLAEWREMAPDEMFSVPGYISYGRVETRTVADWIAGVGAFYGPCLFTTSENGPG
jgi:hypothetical protein